MKTEDLKPGQLVQQGRGQLLSVLAIDEDYIKTVALLPAPKRRTVIYFYHHDVAKWTEPSPNLIKKYTSYPYLGKVNINDRGPGRGFDLPWSSAFA
jgi:hypothetical protein